MKLVICLIALAGCAADGATAGPVGSAYQITRLQVSASPCPRFAEADIDHKIAIQSEAEVIVDGEPALSVEVLGVDATQDTGDDPNIIFTVRESWSSEEGLVAPPVAYRLWAHDETIAGMAATSFPFDTPTSGTDCSYGWLVSGVRL